MYHRVRRKMKVKIIVLLLCIYITLISCKAVDIKKINETDDIDNDIIDFDNVYSVQYNKKYEVVPWQSSFKKDSYKYKVDREESNQSNDKNQASRSNVITSTSKEQILIEKTTELSLIPIELLSTTENVLISVRESTVEPDLTVIPLATSNKAPTDIIINETVTLPASTETSEDFNSSTIFYEMTTKSYLNESTMDTTNYETTNNVAESTQTLEITTVVTEFKNTTEDSTEISPLLTKDINNTSSVTEIVKRNDDSSEAESDVPVFTELDTEELTEVPDDYYDLKDTVPTSAPKTDALSLIFGFAGSVVESVVESVAERVVPKGLYDLFKRMQKQNEALEAEKLRSREENGGIGQFTRGVIKTISSGLSKPLSQLMAGVRDIGSLDSDRGFVTSLASGVASGVTSVANVANSMVDVFKDRVQAIYPGTVWCGDGRSSRSGELGLFFFTDTCCRQHDACKLYILAGETKFGLTNTGLFTRSHCSCDDKFRSCLSRTNSLVSGQIGLTYFNVLGPQCFRRAHPIVKCVRRTRITGLKCEEYELDYTKPKMWQWFDNETF